MSAPAVDVIEACRDPALFGPWFRDPATWRAWFSFLRTMFGLPMDEDDLNIFKACTGRSEAPGAAFNEAWLICGRRSGKSRTLATIAAVLACFHDWAPYLSRGERGTVMVVATDRRQARTIFRYVSALLNGVPMLGAMITRETDDTIDLSNAITIEILTANFRTIRGYTLVACLADEIAFWRSDESANPDAEIIAAIRPAMATVRGAMLLCASSAYAKRGVLYGAYKKHFGKSGSPVLVWQADTATMNPTVPAETIAEAYELDPANAAAEFGAQFRSDIGSFISREVVDRAVVPGRVELPYRRGFQYVVGVDLSGGSVDPMTMAIAHLEDGKLVLDLVREVKPPFDPGVVTEEFSKTIKAYGLSSCEGDRYSAEWVVSRFADFGIEYKAASKTRSEFYLELLGPLNSGTVELLDNARLVSQFVNLERRTARSGKDSVDHPPGGHEDLANCVAIALYLAGGAADETAGMVLDADTFYRPNPFLARPIH